MFRDSRTLLIFIEKPRLKRFGEIFGVVCYANILKEDSEGLFKCNVSVRDFSMALLWVCISRRQFLCGDAVNVWLGVMAVWIPAGFTVRSVVANQCDGSHRLDVGLIAQSYGKTFDEYAVLANEKTMNCAPSLETASSSRWQCLLPSLSLYLFGGVFLLIVLGMSSRFWICWSVRIGCSGSVAIL